MSVKLVRFKSNNQDQWGVLKGNRINFIKGDIFGARQILEEHIALDKVKLLAPCTPSKGVCIGLNYFDHAREMNLELPEEPLMFLKPSSSLNYPGGNIEYPAISHNLHYEGELAIVIKKEAYHVSAEAAFDYVLGYTCANDVTARDLQLKDGQWTRGKSFNTFMPIGPWIETDIDPNSLNIKLYVNDEVRQSSNTNNLIFGVAQLVAYVTQVMTLYPGDVILTGTPSGVGPMQVGDKVAVEIEGIGRLENTIVSGK
ncbi:fumarylacetoacetate hydrolase family protein [Desulfosporosinus sp. SB140]|uniref:fumarylacetoacetate hydrolase family protein n=1 Tax=Desulfosporosinus paludis TaxID=3115649 RepID=UPI00388F513B